MGTSVKALRNVGLSPVHVERDPRYVETLRQKGINVIEMDIFNYLDSRTDPFNFLTFFGAPEYLSIRHLVEKASLRLTSGGVIAVTGPMNIEANVDAALRSVGGKKFKLKKVHTWDQVVYVYKK